MTFENHVGKGGYPKTHGCLIQQRSVSANDAGFGQALEAAADLGGGKMHGFSQGGIGGLAVLLHGFKKCEIVAVCDYFVHKSYGLCVKCANDSP